MFTILQDQQRSRSECIFFSVTDNKSSLPPKDNMYLRRRVQNKDKRTAAGI